MFTDVSENPLVWIIEKLISQQKSDVRSPECLKWSANHKRLQLAKKLKNGL